MIDGEHGDRDDHIDRCGVCAMEVDDPIYYYSVRGWVFWLSSMSSVICRRNSHHWLGRCTDHGRTPENTANGASVA